MKSDLAEIDSNQTAILLKKDDEINFENYREHS